MTRCDRAPRTLGSGRVDPVRVLYVSAPNTIRVDVELPQDLARLSLPEGVDRRLHSLLDKQDRGETLSDDERAEADGLVELADLLALLALRAHRG